MDSGLKGKCALVTGGTVGIGLCIAKALAAQECKVAVASRNPMPRVVQEIEQCGGRAFAIRADVSDESQVTDMIRQAIEVLGGIDLYVNNVAAHWDEPATKLTSHGWFNSINTNLSSCVWACRDIARHMIDHKCGSILIVGSTAMWNPLPCETSYRVSKTGLRAYMEVLAVELAPFGIRVNMLTPGCFHTRMTESLDPRLLEEVGKRQVPLRRIGNPQELGASAVLLLSDKLSSYTTGAELVVDGGLKLRPIPVYSHEELKALNT